MLYEQIDAYFTPVSQETENEKWLELRKSGIGGSDAGAVMGLNKYSSPLTVYMQKKGIAGFEGNNATKWGHILEEPIRDMTRKELDVTIETVGGSFKSKEYDFMNANLDGLMYTSDKPLNLNNIEVTGLGGHEIKTSATGEGFSEDEIPDHYYCQVQHYMAVTHLDWFVLTVFILNSRVGKHYIIKRNEDFINDLINTETDFWENYVSVDKMPEPLGLDVETEYLEKLPLNSVIELDDEAEKLLSEEREVDNSIKDLSKRQSELKNAILLKLSELSDGIENADRTTATCGAFKVTYNKQVRKSLDTQAIKNDGLFDKYAKESSFKVLRISEVK